MTDPYALLIVAIIVLSIIARLIPRVYRTWRWQRRRKALRVNRSIIQQAKDDAAAWEEMKKMRRGDHD